MKIYQIHKYGGVWEDSYDYIVASFISKEKADVEKERLEKEDEELSKCCECPLYYCPGDCSLSCGTEKCKNFIMSELKTYCDKYAPDGREKCKNYYYRESSFFKIEEVDVIE